LRGGAAVVNDWTRRSAAAVTSSTARLNTASFARDGLFDPLSLRTNCNADARISASVAGGAKFASVLILRHMWRFLELRRCKSVGHQFNGDGVTVGSAHRDGHIVVAKRREDAARRCHASTHYVRERFVAIG